jgi:glycosyltransferase involved in cell wall biosynthesis
MKFVPVTIVIISKNAAATIVSCIEKCQEITDDIVLIDSGSSDGTIKMALKMGCRVEVTNWDGYGANKNKGALLARYDWILSIDADEVPDDDLIQSIQQLNFDIPNIAYDIRFKSYIGNKNIRYGCWGRDHHIRLFNRKNVQWAEPIVHETLLLPEDTLIKKLEGHLHHFSALNTRNYRSKKMKYARLSAQKYFSQAKKATFLKMYLAPLFHFFRSYFLFMGFLDGREGIELAGICFRETRLKYKRLSYLENKLKLRQNGISITAQMDFSYRKHEKAF